MPIKNMVIRKGQSPLELHARVLLSELATFEEEYVFCKGRRWRFDFALPAQRIAVEIEGGIWSGGRHTRGKGFEQDCEKYNEAALLGWRVFRFTGGMVDRGDLTITMRAALRCLTGKRAGATMKGQKVIIQA